MWVGIGPVFRSHFSILSPFLKYSGQVRLGGHSKINGHLPKGSGLQGHCLTVQRLSQSLCFRSRQQQ